MVGFRTPIYWIFVKIKFPSDLIGMEFLFVVIKDEIPFFSLFFNKEKSLIAIFPLRQSTLPMMDLVTVKELSTCRTRVIRRNLAGLKKLPITI